MPGSTFYETRLSALIGGVVAGGAFGEGTLPATLRRSAGVLLLARAAFGGQATLVLLGLPKAGKRFIELDNRWYRPFCAMLGFALLVGARHRAEETLNAEILLVPADVPGLGLRA